VVPLLGVPLMNNQEILDNADLPDWTHHNDDIDSDVACFYSYIKQVEGINGQEFYKLGFDGRRKIWKRCNGIYNTTRSRIDIERIVGLEKDLNTAKSIIIKTANNIIEADNCEQDSDEMIECWDCLKDFALTATGRCDT
jgi:hypothetical protein